MKLTAMRVIVASLLYVLAYLAVTIPLAWRHPQGEAHGPQGSHVKIVSISTWWVALLVGPPLLLATIWAWHRFGGGRAL
jgi:hypothetical protein